MYLHYYFDKQHAGQVDSELVFNYPKGRHFVVVAHNQEAMDKLKAFMLIYGKEIPVLTPAQAYDRSARAAIPAEIFVTKKAGHTLSWDERNKILCT